MMFAAQTLDYTNKTAFWAELTSQARGLLAGEADPVANAANLSALIFNQLPDVNWAGFYFAKDDGLVVGPFQGLPACVRIPMGKGVCGTAAATRRTQLVADVDAFPGHIPCDAASRSEIVVPLIANDGSLIGVLDVDSPRAARFDEEDRRGLEALATIYVSAVRGDA
jgi:GAF domain-containing protein